MDNENNNSKNLQITFDAYRSNGMTYIFVDKEKYRIIAEEKQIILESIEEK